MKTTLLLSVLFLLGIKDPCEAQNCVANFSWSQGGPNVINFTNTSTGTNMNTNYYWSFGDSQSGWTQNPSHTYVNPGLYYVCLTIFDSSFCQSTYCDSINVTGQSSGFGEENSGISSVSLFPNPSTETASLLLELENAGFVTVTLTDISGKVLNTIAGEEMSVGEHKLNLNTGILNSGIYFVRVSTFTGSITKRLSVLH